MLNRDSSPALCMVLSVAAIGRPFEGAPAPPRTPSSPTAHLMPGRRTPCISVELTDGWYNVQATLDNELSSQVASGRIVVGTKLITSGAVMKGAEDGIDPLDDGYTSSIDAGSGPASARLLLFANSTRKARWDARLGWNPGWVNTAAVKVKLDSVKPGGGDVSLLDVVVYRRYPKMFSVTLTRLKHDSSSTTVLTAAEEEVRVFMARRAQGLLKSISAIPNFVNAPPSSRPSLRTSQLAQYEWSRRDEMTNEKIAEEVNKDVGRYENRVDSGAPEAWKRMMKSNDSGESYGALSVQEQREVDQWKERRTELVHEMQRRDMRDMMDEREDGEERKSRPFVDLLVVQVEEGGSATNPATMRVFDVSDDVYQSLREGVGLRLKGVAVKDNRKNSLVQLLKTQSSCMKVLKLDAEALAER